MAKIKTLQRAITIESEFSFEQIQRLEKRKPKSLQITDENGEVLFRVGTSLKCGGVTNYGIEFNDECNGKACVQIIAHDGDDDYVDELLKNKVGQKVLNLKWLEENTIPQALSEILLEDEQIADLTERY